MFRRSVQPPEAVVVAEEAVPVVRIGGGREVGMAARPRGKIAEDAGEGAVVRRSLRLGNAEVEEEQPEEDPCDQESEAARGSRPATPP